MGNNCILKTIIEIKPFFLLVIPFDLSDDKLSLPVINIILSVRIDRLFDRHKHTFIESISYK